jgi:hypothetical protein
MTSLPLAERTDIHWQQRMCRLCGYKERIFFYFVTEGKKKKKE